MLRWSRIFKPLKPGARSDELRLQKRVITLCSRLQTRYFGSGLNSGESAERSASSPPSYDGADSLHPNFSLQLLQLAAADLGFPTRAKVLVGASEVDLVRPLANAMQAASPESVIMTVLIPGKIKQRDLITQLKPSVGQDTGPPEPKHKVEYRQQGQVLTPNSSIGCPVIHLQGLLGQQNLGDPASKYSRMIRSSFIDDIILILSKPFSLAVTKVVQEKVAEIVQTNKELEPNCVIPTRIWKVVILAKRTSSTNGNELQNVRSRMNVDPLSARSTYLQQIRTTSVNSLRHMILPIRKSTSTKESTPTKQLAPTKQSSTNVRLSNIQREKARAQHTQAETRTSTSLSTQSVTSIQSQSVNCSDGFNYFVEDNLFT